MKCIFREQESKYFSGLSPEAKILKRSRMKQSQYSDGTNLFWFNMSSSYTKTLH